MRSKPFWKNDRTLLSYGRGLRASSFLPPDLGRHSKGLTLSVLAAVAQWERDENILRQRAGIAAAKAAGKYRGRAPTARAKTSEVLRLKAEGKTVAQIAQTVGISRASIYRAFAETV
ncbi:helix-turn-helix domain-containing protein [Brevundimonas pondensis]|uniref:Helix-turn-helix domain-containing protein n=1 Tax=Brevundimonas pondensis TaxID=2774189 RepID=A0ABX7STK9_9CAUL|nr:helix-turn-helix domain-containing protein [Brevundimonas pondensis]